MHGNDTVAGDWANEGTQLSNMNAPSYAKMYRVQVVARNAELIIPVTDTSRKTLAVVAVWCEDHCCLLEKP